METSDQTMHPWDGNSIGGEWPLSLEERVTAIETALPQVPPIFHHLFALLPKPGDEFSREDRVVFLRAFANIADLIYGPAGVSIALKP